MSQTQLLLASSSPRRQELIRLLGLPVEIMPSDADESVPGDWKPERIVEELSLRKAMAVRGKLGSAEKRVIVGSDTIVVLEGRILGKPRDAAEAADMLRALQGRKHEVYSGLAVVDASCSEAEQLESSSNDQPWRLGQTGQYRLRARISDGRAAVIAGHTVSAITFRPMDEAEIESYVQSGEPMDKAGGYDTTMHLGDIGQYRIISESPDGRPEIIVGHTVSKVTFRPMSDEEIWAYVKTGDPLDKAGAYGVQGIGSVFIEKIEGDFYSIMGLPLNLLYQMLLMFGISLFNQS